PKLSSLIDHELRPPQQRDLGAVDHLDEHDLHHAHHRNLRPTQHGGALATEPGDGCGAGGEPGYPGGGGCGGRLREPAPDTLLGDLEDHHVVAVSEHLGVEVALLGLPVAIDALADLAWRARR